MGNVRLYGSTSGYTELAPPAVAPDGVLSLPSGTGTLATQDYAAAAGGLVHINTTTFSAVSSVSVDNCFSATYDNYRIIIDFSAASGSPVVPSIRLRASSTDSTANYEQSRFLSSATSVSNVNPDGTSLWSVGYFSSGDVDEASCNAEIYKPFLARITSSQINLYQATGNYAGFAYGYHNSATSYDGLTLLISSGTITGTLRIYGYKNS